MATEVLESVDDLMTRTLLTRHQVEKITGLSCSSLYRLMDLGEFPRPVKVGQRAVRWRRENLESFLADRPVAGPETKTAAPQ